MIIPQKRKIEAMHEMFGVLPGKSCEDCSNLIKGQYRTKFLRKCIVYGATNSEATDWRKGYTACGLFGKEWNGNQIVDVIKGRKDKALREPLSGQMKLMTEETQEGEKTE